MLGTTWTCGWAALWQKNRLCPSAPAREQGRLGDSQGTPGLAIRHSHGDGLMPGQDICPKVGFVSVESTAGSGRSRKLIPMVLLGHRSPQNGVLGHEQGRLMTRKAYESIKSLSVSQGKREMSFLRQHNEGQSLLHNTLEAWAALTLWFSSRTYSCCHIYAIACTVCVVLHSWTVFWNMLISPLKEETQVELPG